MARRKRRPDFHSTFEFGGRTVWIRQTLDNDYYAEIKDNESRSMASSGPWPSQTAAEQGLFSFLNNVVKDCNRLNER